MKDRPVPAAPLLSPAVGRTLVEATARALLGRDCADLSNPTGSWPYRLSTLDKWRRGATAIPADRLSQVRPDNVADWIVRQYPEGPFPAVVLGSPHGSSAHLAAMMGAPWLPTGFQVDVVWTDGTWDDLNATWQQGARIGRHFHENTGVAVRQVHDPLRFAHLATRRTTHHVSWRELPAPYRAFLEHRLDPHAAIILISDVRRWPLHRAGSASVQIGSPASGLTVDDYATALASSCPATTASLRAALSRGWYDQADAEHAVQPGFELGLRDWASRNWASRNWAGSQPRTVHTIAYRCPSQLAAAAADVHRDWLRAAGKTGNRLVVECGRLLDPHHVGRSALVPYWCETSSDHAVRSAQLWLAGSEPFSSIEALPEPASCGSTPMATLEQWQTLARFAVRRGMIDRHLERAYPTRPLSPSDASGVLRHQPCDLPRPPVLPVDELITRLRQLTMNASHMPPSARLDIAS